MKRILLGNEALALGAYAAGVSVATGYPGTPSTEILELYARYPGVYAEWSPNEKVALEVGIGASTGGARTMVTMKHVGLNVAADPFFAAAYTGVKAGLVVVTADDPGMHSSQGEQDSRNYAKFAKVPMLEPADSQDCFDMMRIGLEMSETFDTPVLLRTTGRVSHAQSLVEVDPEQVQRPPVRLRRAFKRIPEKYVMLPAYARQRREVLEERLKSLLEYAEATPLNQIHWGNRNIGIVTGSMAYHYAREVFPEASFLKLGMAYPLPRQLIVDFARQVETLLIVEELDPFLEEQIRAIPDLPKIRVMGREVFPGFGEFSPERVARCALDHGLVGEDDLTVGLSPTQTVGKAVIEIPERPPILCPGCGHRGVFYVLRQLMYPEPAITDLPVENAPNPYHRSFLDRRKRYGVVVTGDIGCYTLGALQPLYAMDTTSCMGASIGQAIGLEKAGIKNKIVAVIGDSTFYHSGITGLIDVITSGAATTVLILDNFTTAMTGGNVNPGTGKTVDGRSAQRIELETLCKGLGVKDVQVISGFDTDKIRRELDRTLQSREPSVLIIREPCVLQAGANLEMVAWVDADKCTGCWACLVTACPALIRIDDKVAVSSELCMDCQVCNRICPHNAILRLERKEVKL